MNVVGELALWTALFLAGWGCAVSFTAAVLHRPELAESGARAVFAATTLIAVAAAALWVALLRHDFTLEYVVAHTTTNMPAVSLVTAFWGGPAGLTLWWALSLAICSAIDVAAPRRGGTAATPWITGALMVVLAIALGIACFAWNPFDRAEWVPGEGRGLEAALHSGWAAPQIVTMSAAYAAAVVAVVITAAGARRGAPPHLRRAARGWLLATWCLLTAGLALEMRWSYTEPSLGAGWWWHAGESARFVLWVVVGGAVRSLLVRGASAPPGATVRRAPAMYGVYLGLAILVVGLVARRYWTDETIRLRPGQSAALVDPYGRRWRFVSQGASRDERSSYLSTGVAVEAWGGDAPAGIVSAERRQHLDGAGQPVGEPVVRPGIRSFAALDLYLLLAGVRGELAELRVSFRPLVICVWIGWAIVLVSALAVAVQLMAPSRPAPAAAAAGG